MVIKYPCKIYLKNVSNHRKAIQCDTCDKWVHASCNKIDNKDYKRYVDSDLKFLCMQCSKENIPFCKLNDNEFYISVKKD